MWGWQAMHVLPGMGGLWVLRGRVTAWEPWQPSCPGVEACRVFSLCGNWVWGQNSLASSSEVVPVDSTRPSPFQTVPVEVVCRRCG